MRVRSVWVSLAAVLVLSGVACKSPQKSEPAAAGGSAAAASVSVAPGVALPVPPVPPAGLTSSARLPEGPLLAIQAGQGVGPIRIGATVATIERLMEAPCDVKTADVCRYITRAVEFQLKDGATERIVVHRKDRPAGPDAKGQPQAYGFFNGGIPPGVGLGMIPTAVLELIGPPQSSERVTVQNDFNTVERASYPGGMLLEYDTYTNGRVMLGGVVITKKK